MIKISLSLTFLTFIFCAELAVRNWTGHFTDGEQTARTYQKSEWSNIQDLAVYGWFKINSALSRTSYTPIYQLTSNDANFASSTLPGDRVLCIFNLNFTLYTGTYTPGNTNAYVSTSFTSSDIDKWNFFYTSYGSTAKRVYTYYNFFSSGVKNLPLNNIVHYPSTFYRLYIGQSATNKYFPGYLQNIYFKVGNDAYKETNFQSLMLYNPNDPAPVITSNVSQKLKITLNSEDADVVFSYQC